MHGVLIKEFIVDQSFENVSLIYRLICEETLDEWWCLRYSDRFIRAIKFKAFS